MKRWVGLALRQICSVEMKSFISRAIIPLTLAIIATNQLTWMRLAATTALLLL